MKNLSILEKRLASLKKERAELEKNNPAETTAAEIRDLLFEQLIGYNLCAAVLVGGEEIWLEVKSYKGVIEDGKGNVVAKLPDSLDVFLDPDALLGYLKENAKGDYVGKIEGWTRY